MRDILTPGARLVNTSSHLGHLSLINGEAKNSMHLREGGLGGSQYKGEKVRCERKLIFYF